MKKTFLAHNFRPYLVIVCFLMGLYGGSCEKKIVSPGNSPPVISSFRATKENVHFKESIVFKATYSDVDGDSLAHQWLATKGDLTATSEDTAVWVAPDTVGTAEVTFSVDDRRGGVDYKSITIFINNQSPQITEITIHPSNVFVGNPATIVAAATDPDEQPLTYSWDVSAGIIVRTVDDTLYWTAPSQPGVVTISVTIRDNLGGEDTEQKIVQVYSAIGSIWVCDTFNDAVVKISSAGEELFRLPGFSHPHGIGINLTDRSVWIADRGNNRVIQFSTNGSQLAVNDSLQFPNDVDVWNFDGGVWVAQNHDSVQVIRLDVHGKITHRICGLDNPQSIAVNQITGDIWISDTGNDRVILLKKDVPQSYTISSGQTEDVFHTEFRNLRNPHGLAIVHSSGQCWVTDTDNNRIVRFGDSGPPFDVFEVEGFTKPEDIAVNNQTGSIWVANTIDNSIVKIFKDIDKSPPVYNIKQDLGFHLTITSYRQPMAVSANEQNGGIWFAEEFRIVQLREDGTINKEVTGFNSPMGLVVNPGVQ